MKKIIQSKFNLKGSGKQLQCIYFCIYLAIGQDPKLPICKLSGIITKN